MRSGIVNREGTEFALRSSILLRTVRVSALAVIVLASACAAPFSELQSARLAGRGVVEITPSYSYVGGSDEDESAKLQDNFGVQLATGLSSRVDLRARIEHMRIDVDDADLDFSATAVGFGPKFGLIPNQLALYLPFGFAFGDEVEQADTWQVHPTLIWTIPVADALEINSSIKALVPLAESDTDVLGAFNIGLGISPDLSRWAIRPEFGILKNPGEEGTVRHFSLGATFYLGKR
jgi:hypothetical protein